MGKQIVTDVKEETVGRSQRLSSGTCSILTGFASRKEPEWIVSITLSRPVCRPVVRCDDRIRWITVANVSQPAGLVLTRNKNRAAVR